MTVFKHLLITAAVLCLAAPAMAQDSLYLAGPPQGSWEDGGTVYVQAGVPIVYTIHMSVGADDVLGQSNGYEVYISDQPTGGSYVNVPGMDTLVGDLLVDFQGLYFDGGYFINFFDGVAADTIGFGGFGIGKSLPAGSDFDAYTITTQLDLALNDAGYYLCIDSAFYPPGGAWLWSTTAGDKEPGWSGLHCYGISAPLNMPPEYNNFPGAQLAFDHCVTATYDFDAADPDPEICDPPGDGTVIFSMVSGPGSIDPVTGVWSYSPTLADVGSPHDVTIRVEDACGAGTDLTFEVVFTNNAPTITCPGPQLVGPNGITLDILADDVDCDPGSFSMGNVSPIPAGTYGIDPATGEFSFTPDAADFGVPMGFFEFTVEYSDGNLASSCTFELTAIPVEFFEVQIEKTHGTFQGGHEFVDVTLNNGSEELWGFDFLIAYDASALSFQTAVEGSIYDLCNWEYFTYRYGANGNCGSACPSGLLRVVGLAETNNGANHPSCFLATGETLFTLDFLVSDNRTYECQYVPIRFYWMDCGDNAVSYRTLVQAPEDLSQTMGISREVYDLEMTRIDDPLAVFPTYLGAPDICLEGDKEEPVRFVDFVNGGIDIVCADSIDARGDLNLNGESNEIADVVLYSNYFVYGPAVLGTGEPYQAAVAASDVNADGIPLSIADLVYQLRIIVGDALPYPKTAPVELRAITDGHMLAVDGELGAAYVEVSGNVTPELLVDGELLFNYDANRDVTRVLAYTKSEGAVLTGSFLDAGGAIVNAEMATYEGQPVAAKLVPSNYLLEQNYPNPFNPTTTISFNLPVASDYTLTVYNVTGQEVRQFSGYEEAGLHNIEIDGADLASGVYFYNLTSKDFSETRKMMLLK